MKTQIRSIAFVFATILLTTQLATAAELPRVDPFQGDAAAQAAQQATAAAQIASRQAQQASDQAMRDAQAAAPDPTQSVPAPISRSNPDPVPLADHAPIPAQIAAAHTVFLSNSGADANFPVDETRAYNDVYAAMQRWGRYQFVTSPAQADLIFQLRDAAPITDVTGNRGGVYSLSSPAFVLTILDARNNTPLWTVTSPVTIAGNAKSRATWLSLGVTNLVSRVKILAGEPLSSTESADLTTVPNYHYARNALLITGGVIAFGVAGGLILHHEFENSLADQKAQQDAFCTANHIPLSECAGG